MESLFYRPEGESVSHEINAEVVEDEENGRELIVKVESDGTKIGEIDVSIRQDGEGYISGLSDGQEINNGYLRPAALAVAACLQEYNPKFKSLIYMEDGEPI